MELVHNRSYKAKDAWQPGPVVEGRRALRGLSHIMICRQNADGAFGELLWLVA